MSGAVLYMTRGASLRKKPYGYGLQGAFGLIFGEIQGQNSHFLWSPLALKPLNN